MYADVHANEYVNMKKIIEGYPVIMYYFGKEEELPVFCCSIVTLVIVGLC